MKTCSMIILAAWLLLGASVVAAQTPGLPVVSNEETAAESVAPPSPNDLRELMRLLGDERVSAWLRQQANRDGLPAENNAALGLSFQQQIQSALAYVQFRATEIAAASVALLGAGVLLDEAWDAEMSDEETLRSAIYVIIFLFVGAGLEWLYWRYAGGALRRIELGGLTTLGQSVSGALIRGALLCAGIFIFALGALGAFLSFDWPPFAGELVLSLLLAVVVMRVVFTLAAFILAPRVDGLRLLPLDRPDAKLLFNWTIAVGAIGVIGFFAAETLDELAIAPAAVLAVKAVAGMIFVFILITAVWRLEPVFSGHQRLSEDEHSPALSQSRQIPRHLGSIFWSALILSAFGLWLMGLEEVMLTLIILALLLPAIMVTRVLVNHLFDRAEMDATPDQLIEAEPSDDTVEVGVPEATAKNERGRFDLSRLIVDRLARFTLVILAVISIGAIWGVGILSLSTSPTLAGRAFGVAVDITVALLIADLVWVWAKTAIDRRMANFSAPEPGHTPGPEARMATLLPLLRKILMVTVIVMVVLIGLSSLGVNIGPLLAGAGVMG
ncbi:MAG: hypothetical protein AAGA73_12905, partial [Pseudomonadota bacterium]